MRFVELSLASALLLGLVSNSAGFVAPTRSLHRQVILVPAARYNAAVAAGAHGRRMRVSALRMVTEEVDAPAVPTSEAAPEAAADSSSSEAPAKIPLAELEVGAEYEGVVNNVLSYGCFVDIGAEVNGLVHVSQMAHNFVANPDEVVADGDTVHVKIISLDMETKKVVLSMRSSPRAAHTQEKADVSQYATIVATDPGRFLPGTVESIVKYGAFVRLDDDCSGFLHISQLKQAPERVEAVSDVLTVGQEVQVRIRDVDDVLKRINLSLLPLPSFPAATKDVSTLVGADKNELRTGTVAAVQDYGAFVTIDGVDGLLHISKVEAGTKLTAEQLKERFTVGQEVQVRILNVDAKLNKVSLTMLEPRPEGDLSRFQAMSPDEWMEGTVVSTTDYGAFVHLGDGVDGMVHISQISEQRLAAVTDAVTVGQQVKVRVIEVVPEKRKVRLSMRERSSGDSDSSPAPRQRGGRKPRKNVEKYADVSSEEWLDGTVVSTTEFGAFVELEAGTDGLLHISQISEERLESVQEALSVGQAVKVRVVEVDVQAGRIGLSMREPGAQQRRRDSSDDSSNLDSSSNSSSGTRRGRKGKKDVSALVGLDPNEFVEGKVTALLPYGCFVALPSANGVEGLLHISQLSEDRVEAVEDVVSEGDAISVRVLEVDVQAGTVNLTMLAPGSAKEQASNSRGNNSSGGDSGSDDYGSTQRKKSPRPRFSDYDEVGERALDGASKGAADWQKYLNQYFEKKESAQ